MPTPSFKQRVIHASIWILGGDSLQQIIRLISNLILTRLLVPDMFGLMTVVTALMVGLTLFSDIGLRQMVIHSDKGADPRFLNIIWSMQIVRGWLIWLAALGLGLLLYVCGLLGWLSLGTVYAEPLLPWVIIVTALTAVIIGYESTWVIAAERQLLQKPIVRMQLISQLIGLAVMIIWAWILPNIWSLVFGSLVSCLVTTWMSHRYFPGEPNHWLWDKQECREVMLFGRWIIVSSVLGFLANNGDRLLLAGILSAELMGIYSIAFLIVMAVLMALMKINSSAIFPALSERHRSEPGRLKPLFYRFRLPLDAVILVLATLLMGLGELIINILYDHRYAGAGPILQMLSVILMAQIFSLADQCYLTLGKSKLFSILAGIRAVAVFALFSLGHHFYGLEGALWGIILAYYSSVPVSLYLQGRYGILDIKRETLVLLAVGSILSTGSWFGLLDPIR